MNGTNGNGNGHHYNGFEVPPEFDDNEPPIPSAPPKTWAFDYVPTLSWWLERKLPPRDYLMEGWLTTTSRVLLCGPSGVGKTNFNLGLVGSLAAGLDFLHWRVMRPARVLFVDGENPRELTQKWLEDMLRRRGIPNEFIDNVIVMSREDYPDMPPLNTEEGQQFFDQFLQHIGPVDLVDFDNIQALLQGNLKETEQWEPMLDWHRVLTTRKIGIIWNGHTNDDGLAYGDKTREWQMESVILLEKADHPTAGISFNLKFSKARTRMPETRHIFEAARITLDGDEWVSDKGRQYTSSQKPRSSMENTKTLVLAAIDEALEKAPNHIFGHPAVPSTTPCAEVSLCVEYFIKRYPHEVEKSARNQFFVALRALSQIAYVKDGDKSYVHRI